VTPATVQTLATTARACFETKPDPDRPGETWKRDGVTVYLPKDDRPDWVQELCHHAHGDMLPDDWRYEFIVTALDVIAEADDDADPDAIREQFQDECEADIYTHELTSWLGSRADRAGYCDEACEGYGLEGGDTLQRIGLGQRAEKLEVFALVLEWLEEHAGELNDAAELEDEGADDAD
jgi:hypothetical protein